MRKVVLVLFLCGVGMSLFGQGILFREGSWKEMLALAKKENKLVFVDNYTSWCGPCKRMVKEIFPQQAAGDFYNARFICYKLDCEKGEGVEVARTYQIHSFPTYLFVDGDGRLVYRSGGYMPIEKFLDEGKVALEEFADKRTPEEWDALYARKKNNTAFMKGYIAKRNRSKLDNADILDQYVSIEKEQNLLKPEFLNTLTYDVCINAGGKCSDFIFRNWQRIGEVTGQDDRRMAQVFGVSIGQYSYRKAVEERSWERFEAFLKVNGVLCGKLGMNAENEAVKLRSRFCAALGEREKFEEVAQRHADILFSEEEGVLKRDKEKYGAFLKEMIADPSGLSAMTPEQLAFSIQFAGIHEASSLAFAFRDLAADAARLSDKPELLNKAMTWAMEAIVLFDNFTNYETLAEVLFKMGYKREALWQMKKAVDKMPAGNEAIAARIYEKLNRIKDNQ